MALDDELLLSLAAAIADGSPIDWPEVEARAPEGEALTVVRQLRSLAELASVHRTSDLEVTDSLPVHVVRKTPSTHESAAPSSLGAGRFLVERILGHGSFGVVYQVYDQQRKTHLALKSLHRLDGATIYDIKKEFRTQADLWHPNLVALHDLVADGQDWFIAMELVKGLDFVTYVRGSRESTPDSAARDARRPHHIAEWARFGRATTQLAEAVCYLHSHSKLHRDLKPSNVLVTGDGVVKILDFGLTTDFKPEAVDESVRIRGTPAYVAPEQAVGERASETSDWYSVGIMLFEALTGRRPFEGGFLELLEAKQRTDGPAPSTLCDGIPKPLDALCRDLLQRDARARPGDTDVMSRIHDIWPPSALPMQQPPGRRESTPFVGRAAQLAALNRAFEAAMLARAQLVFVRGGSGMGKTALVHHFIQQLRDREPDAVILEGRCFERESVPYKALDSLVDSLSRYLRKLSRAEVEVLLPRDVSALTRLFPVLQRVEPIATMRQRPATVANAQEQRRRSFAAFHETLARLNDRHPVVLVIDDLQWGDADSAALIADLMFAVDPPSLLLIGCYRVEDSFSSNALRTLLAPAKDRASTSCDVHHVEVEELSEQEAYRLARVLASTHTGAVSAVDSVVRESAGNPFLINELIQYSASRAASSAAETHDRHADVSSQLVLDSVIAARTDLLGEGAQKLLQVLAVAGAPLRVPLAIEAAGLTEGALEAIASLRAAHLTRTRPVSGGEEIEFYHDRIRESLFARIPDAEVPRLHGRLAAVLQESGEDGDPEKLLFHFHGAGQPQIAATYAVTAADRARDAVAFDRASRHYRFALDLGSFDRAKRREIEIKLGDALAASGRGYESAQAYFSAADGALAAELVELNRRAAEQLLRSGHIDEGLNAIRQVLHSIGLELPDSPFRALVSLLWRRIWLRFRGLGFRERDRSQVSAEALVRVDACWTVATAIGVVDTICGAEFQARHLLVALDTGDPFRVARALALDSAYAALSGSRSVRHQQKLIGMATRLAERVRQTEMLALVTLAKGTGEFFQGHWKGARESLERADPLLRECPMSIAWELDTACLYRLMALFYLGELSEMTRHLAVFLKEARDRDDLTAATNLHTRVGYIGQLVADRPAQAQEEARQGMARWARNAFHAQHSWEMHAYGEIHLYEGRGGEAWDWVQERWPALTRSLLLRIQAVRVEMQYLRARSALSSVIDSASSDAQRQAAIRVAERAAAKLSREDASWSSALSHLVLGCAASVNGNRSGALANLERAEDVFRKADMCLHVAAARRRRGELAGGTEGDQLVREADEWMTRQSIRNPARFTRMLAPGVFGA